MLTAATAPTAIPAMPPDDRADDPVGMLLEVLLEILLEEVVPGVQAGGDGRTGTPPATRHDVSPELVTRDVNPVTPPCRPRESTTANTIFSPTLTLLRHLQFNLASRSHRLTTRVCVVPLGTMG